ncbi:hypothetical protein ACVWXO_010805 [Bradyrhizobium sp. LM2.7]
MFDDPFDVLAALFAIAAFLVAIRASNQVTELRRRLSSLEAMLQAQRPIQPPPMPLPEQVLTTTAAAAPPPLVPEAEQASPRTAPDRSCHAAAARDEPG